MMDQNSQAAFFAARERTRAVWGYAPETAPAPTVPPVKEQPISERPKAIRPAAVPSPPRRTKAPLAPASSRPVAASEPTRHEMVLIVGAATYRVKYTTAATPDRMLAVLERDLPDWVLQVADGGGETRRLTRIENGWALGEHVRIVRGRTEAEARLHGEHPRVPPDDVK